MRSSGFPRLLLMCAVVPSTLSTVHAQELEPRTYSNVPVGVNFVAVGYAYNQGNVFLDPALPIRDLEARLHVAFARYIRTFSLFGLPSKAKVVLPWSSGHWEGFLDNEFRTRDVTGFGDARIGIETIFSGAPALDKAEFGSYRQRRLFGASLDVILPSGQYDSSRLINLGSNRWVINPEIGVSQAFNEKWTLEAAFAVWLYGDNDDFLGGSRLEQDDLLVLKAYVVRSFRPGFWIAFVAGIANGGTTSIDGVVRNTRQQNYRFGVTCAFPLEPNQGLVFNVSSGATARAGPDYDTLAVAYQYSWSGE